MQVGIVAGVHGRLGRIRISPTTDNPDRFRPNAVVYIQERPHTIRRVIPNDPFLLLQVSEVDTIEDALALTGALIEVPDADVPSLPEDAYYHFQLLGLEVCDASGTRLGTLTQVLTTGANDVYVIINEGNELLLPAIGDVIISVGLEQGRMTVAPPEGLEWVAVPGSKAPGPKKRPQRKRRKV
ncbi:MAG: ribosome maturation factor RimM [Chloroflexi bacterium]|nr:ribosome maturation factor RimM [Chloroflexota bacterium]